MDQDYGKTYNMPNEVKAFKANNNMTSNALWFITHKSTFLYKCYQALLQHNRITS